MQQHAGAGRPLQIIQQHQQRLALCQAAQQVGQPIAQAVGLIARLADDVREVGRLEGMPVAEGRTMTAVISPTAVRP